jgi:hypothetical protein
MFSIETLESRTMLSGAVDAEVVERIEPAVSINISAAVIKPLAVSQPRDLVFDSLRDQLLVVSANSVGRYSKDGQLLNTINVGSGAGLGGADISADGKYLYVTETGNTDIYKINLEVFSTTTFRASGPFPLDVEGRPRDVALNSYMGIVAQYPQPPYALNRLREFYVGDDVVSDLWLGNYGPLYPSYFTVLARSADRSHIAIVSRDEHYRMYRGVDGRSLRDYGTIRSLAVSRDGVLTAISGDTRGVIVTDEFWDTVVDLDHGRAGLGFSPSEDVLYVADVMSGSLYAYDTDSWQQLMNLPIPVSGASADWLGSGVMAVSDEGDVVYVAGPDGVVVVDLEPSEVAYGTVVQLSAEVSGSGVEIAGGTVSFVDEETGAELGEANLLNGKASVSLVGVHAGIYRVSAHYGGDEQFTAAQSVTRTLNIEHAASAVSLSMLGNDQLEVVVTSAGGVPQGGMVRVFEGTKLIWIASVTAGVAHLFAALSPGEHTLTAIYDGSGDFGSAQSAATKVIKREASSAELTAPARVEWGKGVRLVARVSSPSGRVLNEGKVQFTDGATTLGSAAVVDGKAVVVAKLPSGRHQIFAGFEGGTYLLPNASAGRVVTVDGAPATVQLIIAKKYVHKGEVVALRAVMSSGTSFPTGQVRFWDGKRVLGVSDLVHGEARLSRSLAVGTRNVRAEYLGTELHKGAVSNIVRITVVQPTTVDLMVVYTRDVQFEITGRIDSLIAGAVADANTALWNSRVPVFIRLVHTAMVDYRESGKLGVDLRRLALRRDGFMDEVHEWRDQYKADLVSLIEYDGDDGGVAYELQDLRDPTNDDFGFSVVLGFQAAAPYYSLAHELGHNFGALHDQPNARTRGATSFAFGHRFRAQGRLYHDVMAYDPGTTIPYFSNPRVKYKGVATGTERADSARTITITAPYVARYRR